MRYGFFDDENREYVITRPDTPLPWINYLGSEAYFGLVSNTAGGFSFYRDARLRRITRYPYNGVPLGEGGRYVYLRDSESGEFWSPSWQPTRHEAQDYSCRHGLGYTIIGSSFRGVRAETKYFVPPGENLEIWDLTLANHRDVPCRLSVFSSVEFCLWDAWDDATNFQRNLNIGEVEVLDGVIYHKTEYRERRNHFAFFACSESLSGFDTQREAFLGPYRGWDRPVAVERGNSANSIAHGWSPIGSHHVRVFLDPGETRRMIFVLGYHENPEDQKFDPPRSQTINKRLVAPVIAKYLEPQEVDAAFAALRAYWGALLGVLQVETPDAHGNRMVNIWNAYQCMVTFNLARSASFFESGVGRGFGFRDANQDLLGIVQMVPTRARARILDIAATQMESGGAYHQYQPLTRRGNKAIGDNFNDDPLWLVLSVAAYLKETGDWGILNESVPYDNEAGSEESLYGHLQRSLRYTLDRLGPHGLPLIGRADWNDCLNLNTMSREPGASFQTAVIGDGQVAESVFIGGMFTLAAREMAEIARWRGCGEAACGCEQAAVQMEKAVLEYGWDGEWFLRAYDARGGKVGSRECAEGQTFVEPQGICVLAGIGLDNGYAEKALVSVRERLATPHGIVLHQPAYSHYDLRLGEISSYPPGYKENAGVFCHTNPWIMIAETILGHGERAYDYYTRINPSARETLSDLHRCEPYVYAQMIAGRDAPTYGEAKNSWLTGTAAWNYVAATQWILGIRPTFRGLSIAPVIPDDWAGFRAQRLYRNARYDISVRRVGPGNEVVVTMDGRPIQGHILPLPQAGQTDVDVAVRLGIPAGVSGGMPPTA